MEAEKKDVRRRCLYCYTLLPPSDCYFCSPIHQELFAKREEKRLREEVIPAVRRRHEQGEFTYLKKGGKIDGER